MNREIFDLQKYNSDMRKALVEKSFFINIIDADIIVDFGCADASLLKYLHQLYPFKVYIGYDISKKMLCAASKNFPEGSFYSDWNELLEGLGCGGKVALVLSSVVHEIYSYSDPMDLWGKIAQYPFDYIVVRDMMISRNAEYQSDINNVLKVRKKSNKKSLSSFVSHWGDILYNRNLIHFLLKYKYEDNWNREVRENYLPIHLEDFLLKLPSSYRIDYFKHETPTFFKEQILQDFGIELHDSTHIKLILSREN